MSGFIDQKRCKNQSLSKINKDQRITSPQHVKHNLTDIINDFKMNQKRTNSSHSKKVINYISTSKKENKIINDIVRSYSTSRPRCDTEINHNKKTQIIKNNYTNNMSKQIINDNIQYNNYKININFDFLSPNRTKNSKTFKKSYQNNYKITNINPSASTFKKNNYKINSLGYLPTNYSVNDNNKNTNYKYIEGENSKKRTTLANKIMKCNKNIELLGIKMLLSSGISPTNHIQNYFRNINCCKNNLKKNQIFYNKTTTNNETKMGFSNNITNINTNIIFNNDNKKYNSKNSKNKINKIEDNNNNINNKLNFTEIFKLNNNSTKLKSSIESNLSKETNTNFDIKVLSDKITSGPEELHFYYIKTIQNGKLCEFIFDKTIK